MRTRLSRTVAAGALFLVVSAAGLIAQTVSPAVGEVVRMLDSEISESIIVRWLDSRDAWPSALSADDLIALADAGASEELLERFLNAASELAASAPPPSSPPVETPAGQPETHTESPSPAGSEAPLSAPVAIDRPNGAAADAEFSLLYRRMFTSESEDGWEDEAPDMYVYVDGELVGWLEPRASKDPTVVRRSLAPGSHTVLVTLESHERRRAGWRHKTRVAPVWWTFETAPASAVAVDVRFEDSWAFRNGAGPLGFEARQSGESLAAAERAGGPPDDWPYLCDDIEVAVSEERGPSMQERTRLRDCVDWKSVWSLVETAPDRSTVLENLAEDGFRPDFGGD